MTRKEEIKCASKDYINYLLDKQEYHNENYTEYDIQQAFEKGAQWADKNPKSPWISVEDDLPCNHEELIDTTRHCTVSKDVIIRHKDGSMTFERMIKNYKSQWIFLSKVTHWMPIPKLPKE